MKFYYLGIDVGGSHLSGALIDADSRLIESASYKKEEINSNGTSEEFIECFEKLFKEIINSDEKFSIEAILGVGISIPGPFNYELGISEINGVKKYDSLFGLNIKQEIKKIIKNTPIVFLNDAASFALGEYFVGAAKNSSRSLILTLGTGFGSTFLADGVLQSGITNGAPENGYLYDLPFEDSIADDYFSTRWFTNKWKNLNKGNASNVEDIAKLAENKDPDALRLFDEFADNFIKFITPWLISFKPHSIVIGGGIAKASHLFIEKLASEFKTQYNVEIKISTLGDKAAIIGAAVYSKNVVEDSSFKENKELRKTQQFLAPEKKNLQEASHYDVYPSFNIGNNKIKAGIEELATWVEQHKLLVIDGYQGVFWLNIIDGLDEELSKRGKKVRWFHVDSALKSPEELDQMLEPYLGGDDPLFGKVTDKNLIDWFDAEKLNLIKPDSSADINILIGCGASLSQWEAPIVYFDLPKNELQFRARAGMAGNLGVKKQVDNRRMYKRFFFVDWIVLNRHKSEILPSIDLIVDEQRPDNYLFMTGDELRLGLTNMAKNVFRPRPWFEPGAWGGTWMKEQLKGLNQDVDNLAWSFELMSLENGIMFESDRYLLEVSFDFIMFNNYKEVLGDSADIFKYDFPIRFDFLDTFDGRNLSIQCHPSPEYIKENFGFEFTQDETYYILDCKDEPIVYLGFQEDVNPEEFGQALAYSQEHSEKLDVDKYIQNFPAKKHDLFLIPHGTIHASGANNLVLEISSYPYIFTFKMYDWLSFDLDGKPRPINIDRGMANVNFKRNGDSVATEFISKPYVLSQTENYTLEHLPTHELHFYDVHRYSLETSVKIFTENKCHVWMLIEGESVIIETENGVKQTYNYAETFIVPASAKSYTIYNENRNSKALLVKAFVKQPIIQSIN
jgi:predicted NBD/HSP70 family sugar kinase/mannose-6-phosphate isomerase class I